MVENSRDLLLHIGKQGTINYANAASDRILGRNPDDLIGRNLLEIIQTSSIDFSFPLTEHSVFPTYGKEDRIVYFLDNQGDPKALKVSCVNFLNDPEINGLLLRAQDVSRQLKMQQEQKYTRDLFAATFRVNNSLCTITDPITGELLDANDAWLGFMGYTREETIGKTTVELNIWGSPENRIKTLNMLTAEGRMIDQELELHTKNGEIRTVVGNAEILKIGNIERIFSSLTDVTDERKRAADLKASEERFRDIADYATDWFWELDRNYRFTFVSEGANFFEGFDYHRMLGKSVTDYLKHLGAFKDGEKLQNKLRAQLPFKNFRQEFIAKNGDVSHHVYSGKPLFDEHGEYSGFRGTGNNITNEVLAENNRVLAEERLRQAQKMEAVGQLTGGIAHDFNNLLSVIIGNSEILEEQGVSKKQVDAILRAATRGSELTQSLLAFSRKQILEPKRFNLDQQLQPMIAMLPRTLGATISIRVQTEPQLWSCYADPGQVENVLLNLAINARDAMLEGGSLDIKYANKSLKDGDFVSLIVQDSGSGMTEETLKHVLEPFFTTKEVGMGSGLGLSMVYGFVDQSKGHLFMTSEMGLGTTIELCLPRAVEIPNKDVFAAKTCI